MRIVGGARNGYCSKESRLSVATPRITIRIEMTMATMGRRMKNCATALSSRLALAGRWSRWWGRGRRRCGGRRAVGGGLRLESHLHAGPHLLHALDDHPLAGLEPLAHDVEVVDAVTQAHRPERDLVPALDDVNDLVPLLL